MFGLFKKKEKYPDLSLKYHGILRRDLDINPYYADAFINKRGEQLSSGEFNTRKQNATPNVSSGIKKLIIDYGYEHFTLVAICMNIYFQELKKGKWVSDEEEFVCIAILIKLKHITSKIDLLFSDWLDNNQNKRWPGLFEKVLIKK